MSFLSLRAIFIMMTTFKCLECKDGKDRAPPQFYSHLALDHKMTPAEYSDKFDLGWHKCSQCGFASLSEKGITIHVSYKHTKKGKFVCLEESCAEIRSSIEALSAHINKSHNLTVTKYIEKHDLDWLSCKECADFFSDSHTGLMTHIALVHSISYKEYLLKNNVCEVCGKTFFMTRKKLKAREIKDIHKCKRCELISKNIEIFECQEKDCDFISDSYQSLRAHLQSAHHISSVDYAKKHKTRNWVTCEFCGKERFMYDAHLQNYKERKMPINCGGRECLNRALQTSCFELTGFTHPMKNPLVSEKAMAGRKNYSINRSKPEILFFDYLSCLFDDVLCSKRINHNVVDMVVGDDVLIQVDGIYWHNLDNRIKKGMEKTIRDFTILEKAEKDKRFNEFCKNDRTKTLIRFVAEDVENFLKQKDVLGFYFATGDINKISMVIEKINEREGVTK